MGHRERVVGRHRAARRRRSPRTAGSRRPRGSGSPPSFTGGRPSSSRSSAEHVADDRAITRRPRAARGRRHRLRCAATSAVCSVVGEELGDRRRRARPPSLDLAARPGPWRPSASPGRSARRARLASERRPRRARRCPSRTCALKALNSVDANTSVTLDQLHAEAHVGLVGAEALLRLVPGHAGHRRRAARPVTASVGAEHRLGDERRAPRPGRRSSPPRRAA